MRKRGLADLELEKQHHSQQERKRRRVIHEAVEKLRFVVPTLAYPRNTPRRIVLEKTIAYIVDLQNKLKEDDADYEKEIQIEELSEENARLRGEIALAKGVPFSPTSPVSPVAAQHPLPGSQVVPFTPPASVSSFSSPTLAPVSTGPVAVAVAVAAADDEDLGGTYDHLVATAAAALRECAPPPAAPQHPGSRPPAYDPGQQYPGSRALSYDPSLIGRYDLSSLVPQRPPGVLGYNPSSAHYPSSGRGYDALLQHPLAIPARGPAPSGLGVEAVVPSLAGRMHLPTGLGAQSTSALHAGLLQQLQEAQAFAATQPSYAPSYAAAYAQPPPAYAHPPRAYAQPARSYAQHAPAYAQSAAYSQRASTYSRAPLYSQLELAAVAYAQAAPSYAAPPPTISFEPAVAFPAAAATPAATPPAPPVRSAFKSYTPAAAPTRMSEVVSELLAQPAALTVPVSFDDFDSRGAQVVM